MIVTRKIYKTQASRFCEYFRLRAVTSVPSLRHIFLAFLSVHYRVARWAADNSRQDYAGVRNAIANDERIEVDEMFDRLSTSAIMAAGPVSAFESGEHH